MKLTKRIGVVLLCIMFTLPFFCLFTHAAVVEPNFKNYLKSGIDGYRPDSIINLSTKIRLYGDNYNGAWPYDEFTSTGYNVYSYDSFQTLVYQPYWVYYNTIGWYDLFDRYYLTNAYEGVVTSTTGGGNFTNTSYVVQRLGNEIVVEQGEQIEFFLKVDFSATDGGPYGTSLFRTTEVIDVILFTTDLNGNDANFDITTYKLAPSGNGGFIGIRSQPFPTDRKLIGYGIKMTDSTVAINQGDWISFSISQTGVFVGKINDYFLGLLPIQPDEIIPDITLPPELNDIEDGMDIVDSNLSDIYDELDNFNSTEGITKANIFIQKILTDIFALPSISLMLTFVIAALYMRTILGR